MTEAGPPPDYDLAIIGGGINGTGIARDAAGRGLRVLLVEQNDLASGTSSASSKLIHGGLRYLEHGAFGMVRQALAEREVLLRTAPHIIRPLRFVLLPSPRVRSIWMLRAGLFLYDHLSPRKILPASASVDLAHNAAGAPLRVRDRTALAYSDCWVDDARLVVLNAVDAAARGATIRTRTRCTHAERGAVWRLTLESRGKTEQASASVLVNAAGPWLEAVRDVIDDHAPSRTRLVKGSHVVMRKLYDGDHAYVLQADDGRIVFMLPFADDFTLIGTTDVDFRGDPATVAPSADEIAYLCRVVDASFRAPIGPQDVVWSFAGVRSLYDDGAGSAKDVTRDFHLALDTEGGAPLLSVYGGKITTFRVLAEAALAKLRDVLPPMTSVWTKTATLPGGDFTYAERDTHVAEARRAWPFLSARQARRLAGHYGTRIGLVLGDARSAADLGAYFGEDLSEAEVRYLVAQEWAETADDILWRRTKLGLRVTAFAAQRLSAFLADVMPPTGR